MLHQQLDRTRRWCARHQDCYRWPKSIQSRPVTNPQLHGGAPSGSGESIQSCPATTGGEKFKARPQSARSMHKCIDCATDVKNLIQNVRRSKYLRGHMHHHPCAQGCNSIPLDSTGDTRPFQEYRALACPAGLTKQDSIRRIDLLGLGQSGVGSTNREVLLCLFKSPTTIRRHQFISSNAY